MAISSSAVWEVRTTGSDSNGGFYVSGGTDYSQQDTAQLTLADVVTNGTTTVTSATGGFTSAMIGNGINVAGSVRQITAVASTNSITVDALIASATGQAGRVGGACTSPGFAAGNSVSSNTIWVQAGTYTITSATANIAGGTVQGKGGGSATARWAIIGYSSVRGDSGTATLKLGAGVTSASILTNGVNSSLFQQLVLDGNSQTSSNGGSFGANSAFLIDLTAQNCLGGGFVNLNAQAPFRCRALACGSGFTGNCTLMFCVATGCTVIGFATSGLHLGCLSYLNTGSTVDGFSNSSAPQYRQCVAYGNGRDGFANFGGGIGGAFWFNNISTGNGRYGFNTGVASPAIFFFNNASYLNTSGNSLSTGQAVITLTADPFVATGSANFGLNSTTGGGALCRAAGIPTSLPGTATSAYPDIGVAQHADSGVGGGVSRSRTQ